MTHDEYLDALAWLEASDAPDAAVVLRLLGTVERRENTVLGMLTARRQHSEIRDYILADQPHAGG